MGDRPTVGDITPPPCSASWGNIRHKYQGQERVILECIFDADAGTLSFQYLRANGSVVCRVEDLDLGGGICLRGFSRGIAVRPWLIAINGINTNVTPDCDIRADRWVCVD